MPKQSADLLIDRPYDLGLRRVAGRSSIGSANPNAVTYSAGDAIEIDLVNAINVVLEAAGAIGIGGAGGLRVNVGNGVKIDTNALTLDLATDPALEYSTGQVRVKVSDGIARGSAGIAVDLATNPGLEFSTAKLRVKAYHGLELSSNGVGVKLKSGMTAMTVDSTGLYVADAIAGAGLTINATTKVLAVGAGDGIDVNADDVAVDVTDIINVAYGLYEPSANDIGINIAGSTGLTFTVGNALSLGAPSSLSVSSSNHVTSTTHGHAITSSSDVGTTPAAAILASNSSGQLTLAQLTLRGNLVFAGGDRSITASNKLTLAPSGDLLLDPTGSVLLPDAQEMKTETFSDLVTGIAGFRLWDRGSNYRQLTLGALKADEMYVRVFVADETRIDRGEEYWSKSYGVVETDFTLPADEATVDVWFENSPGLAAANLFSTNDWLLARTIDWDTSLTIEKIWFQVVSLLTAGSVDGYRQQWRIRRKSGGTMGTTVKKGNTILDAGQVGQGWIHLSALDQDGGPFIQIGEYTSVSGDVPQFTNYVRMGNLNGTVDYAADTWGFAAGSNLGTAPSAGFSGLTADATDGLRLFNTDLSLYDGSTLVVSLDKTLGLQFDEDSGALASEPRFIEWKTSLPSGTRTSVLASYTEAGPIGTVVMTRTDSSGITRAAVQADNTGRTASIIVSANATGPVTSVDLTGDTLTFEPGGGGASATGTVRLRARTSIADESGFAPVSIFHVKESTTATSTTAGATIEQGSTGDAVLHFLLTGVQRIMMGIDNSDGDKFKIGDSTDLASGNIVTIDPSTNYMGLSTASPGYRLHIVETSAGAKVTPLTLQNASDTNSSQVALRFGGRVNLATEGFRQGEIVMNPGSGTSTFIFSLSDGSALTEVMRLRGGGTVGINVGTTPASMLHIYESTSNTGATAGVTIEQASTGDAVLHFLLTGAQRWMAGIDNSVSGDPFVISSTGNLSGATFRLTTAGLLSLAGGLNTGGTVNVTGDVIVSDDIDVTDDAVIGGDLTVTGNASIGVDLTVSDDLTVTGTTYILDRLSVGTSSAPGAFADVHGEAAGDTAPIIRASFYGTGTARYSFMGRRARGSISSPSAVQNGDVLFAIGSLGYTSSGWSSTAGAEIDFSAAEAYTGSGRGSKMTFWVVKIGGSTPALALDLGDDRQIFAPGAYAFTTGSAANVNVNTDGQLRLSTSARRFKTDIRPMPMMPEVFDRLQPVLYKPAEGVGGQGRDWPGLIAEDVADAGGEIFVTYNERGQADYVMYDRLVVLTIGEVQALKRRITELERRVNE